MKVVNYNFAKRHSVSKGLTVARLGTFYTAAASGVLGFPPWELKIMFCASVRYSMIQQLRFAALS